MSISIRTDTRISRRGFLVGAAVLSACAPDQPVTFAEPDWRVHFQNLDQGAILANIATRRLAFWGPRNTSFVEYPIGVPSGPELARRGRTSVVRKRAQPTWAPTPSMRRRNPDLPSFVPAGPDNPLGEYALYLGWQYYAIHGTNDPATIGRRTTSGCFRLFPGHIRNLFDHVEIGTPVVVI